MKKAEQALDHIQLFLVVSIVAACISFVLPVERRRVYPSNETKTLYKSSTEQCEEIKEIASESGLLSSQEIEKMVERCRRVDFQAPIRQIPFFYK